MKIKIDLSEKWLVLITVCLGAFMSGMASSMINISFPRLSAVFKTDVSIVLWVTVAFLLVSTGLMPVLGKIGDIFGRKKVYIIGLALFTLGLILCAISQNIFQLIIFRIVQAVGAAIITALSFAIVTASFGDEERGKALGILTSTGMAGPLAGPILSGIFLDMLDWRSLFYLIIPLGIAALVMSWIFLKDQRISEASPKIDYLGAGSLFGSLGCLLLFLNMGGRIGFTSPVVLVLIVAAVILFVVFYLRETKITYPIVDLRLFKNGVFTLGNISQWIQSLGLAAYIFLTPFYLIDGLGYSSMTAGFVYVTAPLVTALLAPLSGWMSDRVNSRILCVTGMILLTGALFMFSRLTIEATALTMAPGFIVYGIGMAFFRAPNASVIMGSVAKDKLGIASALMSTLSQIGMSAGMAIFGLLFTMRKAVTLSQLSQNLEPDLTQRLAIIGGYQDAILIAAVISIAGILTAAFTNGKPLKAKQPAVAVNK